jgi:hypothetical protein
MMAGMSEHNITVCTMPLDTGNQLVDHFLVSGQKQGLKVLFLSLELPAAPVRS